MARLQCVQEPLLRSSAQLIILPVNSTGKLIDGVLQRCRSLYPDNYLAYRKACLEGSLLPGQVLIVKLQREQAGLSASSNRNRLDYIANLVISDHPYHPSRMRWLEAALTDLAKQLYPLIRYQGLRHVAVFAKPLLYPNYHSQEHSSQQHRADDTNNAKNNATPTAAHTPPSPELNVPVLDWQKDVYPLINAKLDELPKARIDVHL